MLLSRAFRAPRVILGVASCFGLLCLATPASAAVVVFNNFAAYNAAVAGNHTLFLNFEVDKFGNPVVPSQDIDFNGNFDIDGNTFSNVLTYSSPDAASGRVNIADVDQGVDNEIGPFNAWTGRLRGDYTSNFIATGFTGVDMEPTTIMNFYQGNTLVNSTAVGGAGGIFEFFGFLSDTPFNRFEVAGDFYAIDAHYSTAVIPEPAMLGLGALGLLTLRRRQRA